MAHRKDTGEILGVHIMGLHAADLIHEASNAIATGQTVTDIKFNVHAHPTLSEVSLDCTAFSPLSVSMIAGCFR